MAVFSDVWERLKERAREMARESKPCTAERAREVVADTLRSFRFEDIPEGVREWLAGELCGFVEEERQPPK